ncbi:DNA repair protein [Candidatus Pacearchaeota archaeon]|nr:DNA repair protein [Candidatus Pacearchaeota archaeon]
MKVQEIKLQYNDKMTVQDAPKITQSEEAVEVFRKYMKDDLMYREVVYAMLLNRNNRVKGIFKLSEGGIHASVVDVKLLMAVALKTLASGIILAHNHPSGNCLASEQDLKTTKSLKRACEFMDITFLDHIIITDNEYKTIET